MNKTKTIILSTAVAVAFLLAAPFAFAATTCTPLYGGGQSCIQTGNLLIDKKVQNPQNNAFVDNLGVNDPRYAPNQNVNFEITVTNTGTATFNTVTIQDTLPKYVALANGNTTMTLNDLKPNESRKVMLVGKVVDGSQLPGDQMITCVVNLATASADNQSAGDNAQFCIEKGGQTVTVTQPGGTTIIQQQPTVVTQPGQQVTTKGGLKVFPAAAIQKTPPTGPEAFALFGLIPSAVLGYFLRKRSKLK